MPTSEDQRASYAEDIEAIRRANIAWARQRNEESMRAQPGLAELRSRLLALGGEEVNFYHGEPYLDILLARGLSFGKRSRVRRGIPHRCYHNAADLWHASGGQVKMAVGYTLWDGMWYRHAWAVAPLEKPPVIETTRKREHYYGVILTDGEAAEFYKDEWIPPYQPEP